MKKNLVFSLVAPMLLLGCSRGTQLVVINQSDLPLTEVLVSGSGFSQQDGKLVSFGPEGYFEGSRGYLVTPTVSPSLTVSLKSELVPY
jgi:hypothetical protein